MKSTNANLQSPTAGVLLLDEKQVAERLRCSEATVTRLRQRGALSFLRVGGRLVRFREQDLNDYLARAAAA